MHFSSSQRKRIPSLRKHESHLERMSAATKDLNAWVLESRLMKRARMEQTAFYRDVHARISLITSNSVIINHPKKSKGLEEKCVKRERRGIYCGSWDSLIAFDGGYST